jgi:hypothetical protein
VTHAAKTIIPALLLAGLTAVACSTGTGTVALDRASRPGILTGQLIMEGGPPVGGDPRSIPGRVDFIQRGRVVAAVPVGADGSFSQALGPGTYQVRACTSKIQQVASNGSRAGACESVEAQVLANRTETVVLRPFIVP